MTTRTIGHQSSNQSNYSDLQRSIDELVGKHGLEKTVDIIRHFSGNTRIPVSQPHRLKLISDYITSQCIMLFDLEETNFHASTITEYREARMACYHLLKIYTDSSYARIGERFGWNLYHVFYFCKKCEEILSIPQYYKPFIEKYSSLEKCTINFIANL